MSDTINRRVFSWLMAVLSLAIGGSVYLWLYGVETIDPGNVNWLLALKSEPGAADQAQHFLGWHYFLHSPWDFPLGKIPNYVNPFTTATIAYTDSIPWLGVLSKLISPLAPTTLQYSGLWLLSCFALSAFFGQLILRQLQTAPLAVIVGTVFFAASPPLLYRQVHIALCGHWLILAGIAWYLHFAGQFVRRSTAAAAWGLFLAAFSCITHPYLAAMVSAIVVFGLASYGGIAARLGRVGLLIAGNLLALYVFGYIPSPISTVGGAHFWSADFFTFLNSMGQSGILPAFPVWGGQYEGFAFLGSGGIFLLLLVTIVAKRRKLLRWQCIPHRPLVAALGLLFVYGLSSNIRFFSKWLISLEFLYGPFSFLTAAFRASGRFVWPLYYFLLAALFAACSRWLSKRQMYVALAAAGCLQVLCQWPVWQKIRSQRPPFDIAEFAPLAPLLHAKKSIKLIPPFINYLSCTSELYPVDFWIPVVYYAGLRNQPVNSGSVANPSPQAAHVYCQKEMADLAAGIDPDTAYVFHPKWFASLGRQHFRAEECQTFRDYTVCAQ